MELAAGQVTGPVTRCTTCTGTIWSIVPKERSTDWHDRCLRYGRPTGTTDVSIGPGRPGRSTEDRGRSTGRSIDRRVLSLLNGFGLLSYFRVESNCSF